MNEAEQPLATGGNVENSEEAQLLELFIEQDKKLPKHLRAIVYRRIEEELKKQKAREAEKKLIFKGYPIDWVEYSNTNSIVDARDAIKKKDTNRKFGIRWNGVIYKPEDFFKKAFPDYKKYPYKVTFLNENIKYISESQRIKLQYEALEYIYTVKEKGTLVYISKENKDELLELCIRYSDYVSTAKQWLRRMNYKNGLEKMITFGASISASIKEDTETEHLYCYRRIKTDNRVTFIGVKMEINEWIKEIERNIELIITDKSNRRTHIDNALNSIYYQYGTYLTLNKKLNDTLRKCVFDRIGMIDFICNIEIPNADLTFTIDFDKDIKIKKMHENIHNRDIKGRNEAFKKFGTLCATKGDIYTRKQLLELKFNDKNIRRYIDYGFMNSNGKGTYTILIENIEDLE